MTCPLCRRSKEPGWLCEEHDGPAVGHDGCGGAGAPCTCNPSDQVVWRQVYADVGTGDRGPGAGERGAGGCSGDPPHAGHRDAQADAPARRLSYQPDTVPGMDSYRVTCTAAGRVPGFFTRATRLHALRDALHRDAR